MKKKTIFKLITALCLTVVVLCNTAVAYCGEKSISELVLRKAANADELLEKDRYNVIYVNLNKTNSSANNIYMGYKTGEDAITGVIVSAVLKEKINIDGINYIPVSDINLNEGSKGQSLYLYYTKDEAAGAAIVKIDVKTQYSAVDEILLDDTNEYKVVLTDEGEKANLEEGKEGYVTYIMVTRSDDETAHPKQSSSYTSIDTSKGDLRDEEKSTEKAAVDDSSELERQAIEEAKEQAEQEQETDSAIGKSILFGGIAVIAIAAVLVLAFSKKKKGAEKNEK